MTGRLISQNHITKLSFFWNDRASSYLFVSEMCMKIVAINDDRTAHSHLRCNADRSTYYITVCIVCCRSISLSRGRGVTLDSSCGVTPTTESSFSGRGDVWWRILFRPQVDTLEPHGLRERDPRDGCFYISNSSDAYVCKTSLSPLPIPKSGDPFSVSSRHRQGSSLQSYRYQFL